MFFVEVIYLFFYAKLQFFFLFTQYFPFRTAIGIVEAANGENPP